MSKVKLDFVPKFEQSKRIVKLAARNRELALDGRCKHGKTDWRAETAGSGQSVDYTVYDDLTCWMYNGVFPALDDLPSRKNGYVMSAENWGNDYAFMLDNTPPDICPNELIVGEIYWELHMLRRFDWADTGDEVGRLVESARELGAVGMSHMHTCPDIMIGLTQGYKGILERIRKSMANYERLDNPRKVGYLKGLESVCLSCIRYIKRYAALAEKLESEAIDPAEKARFRQIADCCNNIATEPPRNYHEAVQWIHFSVLFDRSVGHGNGYGRLDQLLIGFYEKGIADGTLTRAEAREYIAEMYLKLRAYFFSLGGRGADGKDATNVMSFVALEAYDLVGDYNSLGVMWHPDMDEEFYNYACDVLARHGESIPVLLSYDMMYESNLRSGVPHKHAWNISYSGCQWYSICGREFNDNDINHIVIVKPFERAVSRAIDDNVTDFETLYRYFREECRVTARAMRDFKRGHDEFQSDLWPEMYTSLLCHGPIERGLDIVEPRGVDYQFTSTNVLGLPNVVDSLYAIKELVFKKKMYTLRQVKEAVDSDWENNEPMRQRFLNVDKYGNDIEEVDALFVRVADTLRGELERLYNQKGQPFRLSMYEVTASANPGAFGVGATPDGRFAKDYLAQGVNPTNGVNVKGLTATANSLTSTKGNKYQGAPLFVTVQPSFFDGKSDFGKYIRNFSIAFFKRGGVQINLHIMNFEKLADAIEHPENPEYHSIIVRVTGFAGRFISIPRDMQEAFISHTNYDAI